MPFEKFEARPQIMKREKEPEELGKEAERTIAEPLFQELKEVFPEVKHTSEEVDRKRGVDFVLKLSDGTHLAVDFSIAGKEETWQGKAGKVLARPLIELKEVHPNPDSLSRRERIEEVPLVLVRVKRDAIEEAYHNFERAGRQGRVIDYLPNPRDYQDAILAQISGNLGHFSSDKDLARRFPRLATIARQRNQTLNGAASKLREKEKG